MVGCEAVAGIRDFYLADAPAFDAGLDSGGSFEASVCESGAACACSVVDVDQDGYFACAADPKKVDCNDNDPSVHPGATETCNGKDDDCNGQVDDVPAHLHGSLFSPVDDHWVAAASAVVGTSVGAQLTADKVGDTGAVWWKTPYTFDVFDVTATFVIEAKSDGADGCGFGWVPGVAVPGVGLGTGYGLGGLGGYGVAIDTYQNTGEPEVPFLVILATDMRIARFSIPNVRDGRSHAMRVTLAQGTLNVWVDTIKYVTDFTLPNYAPFIGYWGFAAGGGNAFEAVSVSDLTMSFPSGQGCLP